MEWLVYLVSNSEVPIEDDTLPVRVVADNLAENRQAIANVITDLPQLWEVYAPVLAKLNPQLLREIAAMAQRKHKGPEYDIRFVSKEIGMASTLGQAIDAMGVEALIDVLNDPQKNLQNLSAKDRRKLDEWFKRIAQVREASGNS